MRQALIAAALLCALPAAAQDNRSSEGRPGEGEAGALHAIQFASADPKAVLAAWSESERPATLQGDGRMLRGEPMFTFVVFRGCRTDARGNCNLTADFEVDDPQGRPYVQQKGVRTWVDRPPAPEPASMLGIGYMGLVVEKKDATGPYRVRMTLTDQIAGVSLHTEQVLTVVE